MTAGLQLSARYDVLGLLGAGASADVYRVRDLASGEERALKVLRDPGDAAGALAFRREFLLLLRLRHPSLVNVFEFETLPDGRPAFSAEIALGDGLGAAAPLDGDAARNALRDLALAVHHLHRQGLVHCDLKPDNAVLLPSGQVKLLDLGLAQPPGESRSGGTPAFMAPEVARGAPTDPRADLYSLGAVGYFLLTGRPPFGGDSLSEVLNAALAAPPPPLPPEAPADLARVVMSLLAKDPAARPPLAGVLAALGHQSEAADALPDRPLPAPLCGRTEALEAVGKLLDTALGEGKLRALRLAAPAGAGKDRLVSQLRARRQAEGLRFVSGRCHPGGAAYHPFDEAARALGDDRPPWRTQGETPSSRGALLGACTAWFARAARVGPVAIHLADWHAADPASRALFDHLIKAAPPGRLVLVLTDRVPPDAPPGGGPPPDSGADGPQPGAPAIVAARVDPPAYIVPPLDAPGTGQLAAAMLGGARLDPELESELHRLSEGNPLYLEGILARTLSQALLVPSELGWRAGKPLAAHALPSDLAEALRERLDPLSAAAGGLARVLAVLGHAADPGLLGPAADLEHGAVSEALVELEAGAIVQWQGGCVAFRQTALGEAVGQAIPADERQEIGRRLVLALEGTTEPEQLERDPVIVEDLARHSWAWDPAGRGLRYGLATARRHLEVYAVERAREFLGRGLQHLAEHRDDPAALRLEPSYMELAADADRHAGSFAAARDRYEGLLERLPGDDPRQPRALASLGLACQSLSEYEKALNAFDRAVAAAKARGDTTQELRALTSAARLAYLEGDSARAGSCARAATVAAREAGSDFYLAESLALLGYLIVMEDPTANEMGLEILKESLALRRGTGDLVAVADSLMFLGNAQMASGRPLEALKTFSENLQICRDTGAAAEDAVTALLNIALCRLDLGAFQEAAAGARKAREVADEAGNRDLVVYSGVIEAVAAAETGDMPGAWRHLDRALSGARELESPYLEAAALAIGAEAHVVAGAALQAREDLLRAERLAADAGTREFNARILALQAEAYLLLSEFEPARAALDRLEELATALGPSVADTRWRLLRGDLARRLELPADAESWFTQALDQAENLGMSHAAGLAALGRGRSRAAAGRHEAAREDLLLAQRTAAQIACPHLLVDSLLALADTTFDPAEAGRYREMAEGHLSPLVAAMTAGQRARYLALGERSSRGHAGSGARIPAELEALAPFLDRPLRDLLGSLQDPGGYGALPVGELMGRLLEAEPDPDEVLARTLTAARERFGAERCLAVMREGSEMAVKALIPDSADLVRFSRTFIDMALEQDRTLWTVDALADPRLKATDSVAALEMRAIACTPVRAAGKAVGALYLDWGDPSGGLSDAGRREFETLAGVAGVCLAQAELRAKLETRSERLEMMNELASALARTLDIDRMLELALRHSMTISGAQHGCVLAGGDLAPRLARDAEGRPIADVHVSRTVRERLLQARSEAFALVDAEVESLSASVAAEGLRSVMAVPVRVGEELRGAFYLASEVSVRGFGPRDLALLEAVANQVAVALGRMDLVEALARRERIARELEIARDVQKGLLPKRLPQGEGFQLAAASLPALEVGGDFYDAVVLPDGRVGLFIGDVAGKGVPAALLMATLLSGFRAIAGTGLSPAQVLARLNDLLIAQRSSPGVFSTALYASYDPRTRRLDYACAGHTPPLAVPVVLPCEGPVLGLLPGMEFATASALLEPGAVVAFYTDGLEDARGPEGGILPREELDASFEALARAGSAEEVASGLLALATGGAGAEMPAQYDDITILALSIRR